MILLGESFQCAHKHKLGASVIFDDFVLVFALLICSLLYRANISLTPPLLQAQDACVYVDEEVCQTEKQEVCEDGTEWCEQIYFKEREKLGYQCIANGVGPQDKKWLKQDNFSHFGGTKNGTSGAQIKILKTTFQHKLAPKTAQ